jgi:Transposase
MEFCIKESKFPEEQIVRIPKEVEDDAKVAEMCRRHSISDAQRTAPRRTNTRACRCRS